jgi:hypothetical protein
MPLQISFSNPRFESYMVKAAIDAAVIVGLPSSRSAKEYARRIQAPEPLSREAGVAIQAVGWRKLYFRRWL